MTADNTLRVTAEELTTGDIIPSHDGLEHRVVGMGVSESRIRVVVARSDGDRYTVDYAPSDYLEIAS